MTSSAIVPQILTRDVVPLLSEGLDAGDILECYALVRPAQLHNPMMPDVTMTIHKVAIGLRYRPFKMNDIEDFKIREITLEYGPQRMGATLTQESMPTVQLEQEPVGGLDAPGGNNVNNNGTVSRSFVTWENEGKIYYTTQIASTGYVSAYYMTSVTGAVLGKILEKAVEYPMQNAYVRGRPRRYQPFVVVDGNNELPPPGFEGEISSNRKVMLRSSSSTDFMDYMWYTLAELGVNMHPILVPPTYEVQLLATGVEKVKVGPPHWATQPAASFYEKLYQCIEAKVTGDYSKYAKPTPSPTANVPPSQAPSFAIEPPSPGDTFNSSTSEEGNNGKLASNSGIDGDDGDTRKRYLRADFPGTPQLRETDPPIDALRDIESFIRDGNGTTLTNETMKNITGGGFANVDGTGAMATQNGTAFVPGNHSALHQQIHEGDTSGNASTWIVNSTLEGSNDTLANMSQSPLSTPALSAVPSVADTSSAPSTPSAAPSVFKTNKKDTKSEVDEAQEAADQAKQAAAEAKDAAKTEVDTKAADAAQAAANAAQKAADATSSAAAQAALEALISGDGNTMMSVVSPCFSDPQFGIAVADSNGTVMSHAYLYIDGSSYYKVNLTYPFLQIVPVEHKLPQPRDFAGTGSGGDFLDWTLALMLLFMSIFGVLMLIQQVFGGYVKLIRPLFNFQIWFFNPLHYEDIKGNMEEEQKISGRGQAYSFGQDVIPVSMGGRRVSVVPSPARRFLGTPHRGKRDDEDERERIPLTLSGEHQEDSDSSNDLHEIEMTEAKSSPRREIEDLCRGTSRGSAESGESASSLTFGENGRTSSKVVGNLELVKKDHRIRENGVPSRFRRDPDFVEMPNLKSSSKVAIPVGLKRNTSFYSSGGNTL